MPSISKHYNRFAWLLLPAMLFAISLTLAEAAHASCSSPKNPIEAENCLPGDPPGSWQVNGSGDPTLQGFATDMSVNVGQTIFFKVNTDASNYALEIFRIGYYGGLGGRKVAVVSPSASLPQSQPACLFDNATSLVDCGNWSVSASWQVPANATPGLYIVHLVRQDTGGESQIPFMVRNDASHSDILYQTSDLTWQAYNNYGGHSLYGAGAFDLSVRAFKVSFNRPFNTRSFASNNFIFNAEYPMIRWLEANGYDVSYISGIDTARNGSLLLNHRVYISSGHDEYVDTMQRANIQAARDAGVNLAFFSGNEMFWKTRWENSTDGTNTPYRTMVCYKETLGDAIDPLDPPMWTGTWRDPSKSPPADGGRPENALTGTLFKVNGPGADNTDLSIQVPAADGKLRFWRNTSIAALAPNQVATLPPGTLGYEWDVDPENQVRPAGLFHLSTATYNLTTDYLLDYGGLYGAGTATHHLTLYRAQSGALVFGAGSVQWAWGLDSNHDGDVNPSPDINMQQATVNLFADMGVQPATLQTALQPAVQSADTVAPISTINSPAPGASVNTGSPAAISGSASDSGGGVVAGVEVSVDGGQTWHPAIGRGAWTYSWTPNAVGTIALMSRAVDDTGNLENPQISTGNPPGGVQVNVNPQVCPCSIWNSSSVPNLVDSGDASPVEVGVKFRTDNDGVITGLRFYKSSANTGTHVGHLWTSSGGLLGTATFTGESGSGWQQVTFANPITVTANTTYVASYFAPVGRYSADVSYFKGAGYDNPPVHALADGVDGPNGVFIYTSVPGPFPTISYSATNYWVDIVFVNGSTFNIGGNISGIGGAGATVNLSGTLSAMTIADSTGNYSFGGLVDGPYTVTPSNAGVTFAPISQNVTLNELSQNSVNFSAIATNPLSISGTITGGAAAGTAIYLSGPASLAIAADSMGNYSFNGLIPGSYLVTPLQAGYIFAPSTQSVTLTNTNISTVNFTSQPCPCTTIWQPTATPILIDSGDAKSVEIGVKFRSDVAGHIQALRFYKASTNSGTHIGHIWSNSGTLLGSATFVNESASGWQEVVFTSPVAVSANTTYVASYFSPAGHYSADSQFFQGAGVDNPPLHALANGFDGPDGVYTYSSSPAFPTSSYGAANYWVDVLFMPAPPHNLSGSVTGPGGPGATVTLTGGSTVSTVADASGNFSFTNISDGTYVVTPSRPGFAFNVASQSVTLSGADVTGMTFATLPNCTPCDSIWQPSISPLVSDAGDPQSVNIGVKFRTDSDGYIVGVRFYKSALNTGTHVGTLWSSDGTPLGTVVFSGETPFGWQQALFSAPISVNGNQTYIVSYLAPAGHYAGSNDYFASGGTDSPPLHALANGVDGLNGIYAYGSTTLLPNHAYRSSNYWVDVIYTPGTTHAISGTISGAGGPNATVTLTGSSSTVVVADSAGDFSFAGLSNGNYWISPSQNGYIFSPGVQPLTVGGADIAGVNFSTLQACPCNTIWAPSTVPANLDSGDASPVNVGVKFQADTDGYILGLRYYKAATNTGSHVGTLWSHDGTALATANFTMEAQSGWQQVLFQNPVPVTANTTYVASYLAPAGHYSVDTSYFATNGTDNAPLHALATGIDGPNGVYVYSTTTTFPTQSFQPSNYWVDVIYAGTQTYSIGGTIAGPGGPGASVSLTGAASATTTADASGNYSFTGLDNGSYTVTPSNTGYVFTPASQSATVNSANVSSLNFTSAAQTHTISGAISGPGGAGATVNLTGGSSATTTADASGNYSFPGLANGSYTVTPSNGSYVFSPASQSTSISGANVSGFNFSSMPIVISVALSPSSVVGGTSSTGTVTLSGPAPAGGALVTLSSSNTADVQVPVSVTVAANATTATFTVNTSPVATNSSLTISATYGATQTASFMVTAAVLSSVNLSPASVQGGNSSTGTVTLSGPAPAGGVIVTLSSSNTAAAQVPASVTVAANAISVTFTVTTSSVGTSTSLSISGTFGATQSASLTVTPPALASVGLNPSSVPAGATSTGTITLSGPAPVGGAVVTLSSSNTAAAQVPASVTVAANATTATFTVTTSSVAANTSLTISGTYGSTQAASFTVTSSVLSTLSLNPTSVTGGTSVNGSVTLTKPAPVGGAVVTLSNTNTAAAQVPASVTVAAGATSANFTVTTTPLASNAPLTITAVYGATKTANLTVLAPTVSAFGVTPNSVIGGTSSTATVRLTGPAPAGGTVVILSSNNTAVAQVPPSVTVAANTTLATFTVTTSPVASSTSPTLSATYGNTRTTTLTVTPPTLNTISVSPASVIGGTSSTGTVTLTGPAPAGGAVVTLSSSNTAAAGVPASVTVAANARSATFTVTTSGVATNTSPTISGTYSTTRTTTLTVVAASLTSFSLSPTSVIGGTSSTGTVSLTGPAPAGGAVVTLSSSNTAAAQVTASVTIPANATSATFTVTSSPVATNASSTISATYKITRTANLTVNAPTLSAFSLNPTTVKGLSPSTGTVTLSGPAPTAGSVVTLSSNLTSVATVPANVTVVAGNTTATFTVTTNTVTTTRSVTISATKGGTRTANLTVTP